MAKKPGFVYGQTPAPQSWHDAAAVLRQTTPKKAVKPDDRKPKS